MSRSCASGSGNWLDHLPFVLLGMRTSVRQDSKCSPADLLFGAPLRLPGDMFVPSSPLPMASDFAARLRSVLGSSCPMPVVPHGVRPSQVDPSLMTTTHIFLRVDAVRKPLVPPYLGPLEVISRSTKTFVLLQNGKEVTVSIDRLKPAFLLPVRPALSGSPPPARPVLAATPADSVPSSAVPTGAQFPALDPAPTVPTTVLSSGRISRPVRRFQA